MQQQVQWPLWVKEEQFKMEYGLSAKDLHFLKTTFFSLTAKYNQKEYLEI